MTNDSGTDVKKPRVLADAGLLSMQKGSVMIVSGGDLHDGIRGVNPRYYENFLRKEVIQPQVPLRLPCYDLVPIKYIAFDTGKGGFGRSTLSWLDGRCVQGSGTHSPRCC